jgi:hypothetical protein
MPMGGILYGNHCSYEVTPLVEQESKENTKKGGK